MGWDVKPLVYRGAKEICAAVGLNWKEMGRYVKELKLPAFKVAGSSQWLATHEDLERWLLEQREEFFSEG